MLNNGIGVYRYGHFGNKVSITIMSPMSSMTLVDYMARYACIKKSLDLRTKATGSNFV